MSPRKSGHWASLQQAMNPVQNQEENNQTVPAEEQNANPSAEKPSTSQPDDFEIPRDAFSLFDDEETAVSEPDAAEENQNDELLLDETEEPPAKESEYKWNAVEIKGNDPVEKTLDGDFEIPADAFSMFDDEDEPKKTPKAKPEKAEKREKKADKKEKKLEKRAKKEDRSEDDVEEFAVKSFEEVGDYEERPRRQPKQKPARERRYEEDAPEPREYREPRESRESADVRESEPRRPAINIPSWREVMDMLVEMNMNRRKASERPSRQEKRSRSAAERQREIEEIEDRFEREDVAPRRRRRRPE